MSDRNLHAHINETTAMVIICMLMCMCWTQVHTSLASLPRESLACETKCIPYYQDW